MTIHLETSPAARSDTWHYGNVIADHHPQRIEPGVVFRLHVRIGHILLDSGVDRGIIHRHRQIGVARAAKLAHPVIKTNIYLQVLILTFGGQIPVALLGERDLNLEIAAPHFSAHGRNHSIIIILIYRL